MSKKKMAAAVVALGVLLAAAGISLCVSFANGGSETETVPEAGRVFLDVKQSDWFSADVGYVYARGLMRGTSDTLFEPQTAASRGMVVTLLWRLAGAPAALDGDFLDVDSDAYYYNAVVWAAQCGIADGYGDRIFCPDVPITREQLATVLYRYAEYKKYEISGSSDLSAYTDKDQISRYAAAAMQWANANGIITGVTNETMVPQGNALRCQIAAMLKRFCTQAELSNAEPEETKAETADNPAPSIRNPGDNGFGGGGVGGSSKTEQKDTDGAPVIAVDSVSAKAGEEVWLDAVLTNNPGILGMTVAVYFDESICTLQSVENGEAFRGILDFTPSNALQSGCRFLWDGMEISAGDIKNGAVLRMKFKIDGGAPPGKYPVTLQYADGDIVDNTLISISPQLEAGYITIEQ